MAKWLLSFRGQRLIAALVLFGTITWMAFLSQPPKLWQCMFHKFSGLPCPSCGMTRSLFAAAHGRFKEAFSWHPMGVVLFAAEVGGALALSLEAMTGKRLLRFNGRAVRTILIALMVCLLLCWVIRLCIIFGMKIPLPIYGLV
ncbi:MAG: hypothetical protein GDYSWBUE_001903 [Candidatus Fervidibacterota bacterium]